MGRIYVQSNENTPNDPKDQEPEDSNVMSGRIYVGSTDAAGEPLPVLDTDGDVVTGVLATDSGDTGDSKPAAEPAGNASREEWEAYARRVGATDADLVDADGKELGRDALREKYGTPTA